MHLRDASVDLDGNIIASGTMTYRNDDHGHFPMVAGDQLRISRTRGTRVAVCTAVRDSSGFLKSEDHGPEVAVPEELARVMLRTLWLGTKEPMNIAHDYQAGYLASSAGRKHPHQPLSDWRLHIEESEGAIRFEMSAALRAGLPIESSNLSGNYWGTEGEPDRIRLVFSVDPATRIACYGSHIKAPFEPNAEGTSRASVVAETAGPPHTSLTSLSLESAPVGTSSQFGASGDHWVSFYVGSSGTPCIAMSPSKPGRRSTSGFLSYNWGSYPRLWFYGVDLNVISGAMWQEPMLSLTMNGGIHGYVELGPIEAERPHEHVLEVQLHATLTLEGLVFDYRCHVTNRNSPQDPNSLRWMEGSLVLPWELLILRYPQFLRLRGKLGAAAA